MNPRILKKLCKRADPLVAQLTTLTRVIAEPGEYLNTAAKVDRKHTERWFGKPNRYGYFTPLAGTICYGCTSGYYEPEWEELDAYSTLQQIVTDSYTDWSTEDLVQTAKINNPADVFRLAQQLTPNAL